MSQSKTQEQPLEDRVLTRMLGMPPDPKVVAAKKVKKKTVKKAPKA